MSNAFIVDGVPGKTTTHTLGSEVTMLDAAEWSDGSGTMARSVLVTVEDGPCRVTFSPETPPIATGGEGGPIGHLFDAGDVIPVAQISGARRMRFIRDKASMASRIMVTPFF